MSNIDFSYMVTAETRAAHAADSHAMAAKVECKRRILAQVSFAAQQNITRAASFHAMGLQEGGQGGATALSKADLKAIVQLHGWIAEMQTRCRDLSGDPGTDLEGEGAWPAFPRDAARLVTRF